jgi:putative sugar O-methyltransferase
MILLHEFDSLDQILEDMQWQCDLYKPSSFWEEASKNITNALRAKGIENFRSIVEILSFFVPTYGSPGNSFSPEMQGEILEFTKRLYPNATKSLQGLAQFFSGYQSALGDYRVFLAAEDSNKNPKLSDFSESDFGNPIEQFEFDNKLYSRSSLNYLLGLQLFKKYCFNGVKTVLEIGGGFGTLGEILVKSGLNNLQYIDVDIPPTSFVAENYLRKALPGRKVLGYMETREKSVLAIEDLPELSVLATWQLPRLQGTVDLFVNYISFQEMEPHIVKNYFYQISRLQCKWILLRNMREGKQIRKNKDDVGVAQPILADDYIAMLANYELLERQVQPFGFKTVDNYHSELFLFKRSD